MASNTLDSQTLGVVFQSRPDLIDGIKKTADTPAKVTLFNEIAKHVYSQIHGPDEPAHKKRRVEPSTSSNGVAPGASNAADETVLLEVREISVAVPQRKKFELCFTENHLYARAPGTKVPVTGIVYSWQDIEFAFYLPVPEKTQVQHNYVLFPRGSSLPPRGETPPVEPLVFTIPATTPKPGTLGGSEAGTAAAVSDEYKTLFHWAIERRLRAVGNSIDIVSANPNRFHSNVRQAHRPNEKAVHIGGFRGSKDGYLFFLQNGMLWGYKKPLLFIPLNRVAAISYTSVLQITFNIVVEVFTGDDAESTDELEFGMLDQQDFSNIDEYVKLNRLQDRSMAEQRKGKLQLAENKKKNPEEGLENGAANGQTELEKAQAEVEQELQDEEDEDEEDYDPGSDADSDGSGESSEEDDEDAGEGEEGDEDEDAEGDDGEEEEEVEEAEDEPQAVKQEVPVKQEAPAVRPAPARQGWAAVRQAPPPDPMAMDERFDVV